MREELLQKRLIEQLKCIDIDQKFADWLLASMDALAQKEDQEREVILTGLSKQMKVLEGRKQRLLDMRLNDELSKDEFLAQKAKVEPEHVAVCTQYYNLKHGVSTWKPRFKKDVQLCLDLSSCLKSDDLEAKKSALSDIGSNLTLKGQEVTVDLAFPFLKIAELKEGLSQRFEPEKSGTSTDDRGGFNGRVSTWSPLLEEIRTWYMNQYQI